MIYLQRCRPKKGTAAPWKNIFLRSGDASAAPKECAELREVIQTDATCGFVQLARSRPHDVQHAKLRQRGPALGHAKLPLASHTASRRR